MACIGSTSSVCSGLTTDEACIIPKVYNPTFPVLSHIHLTYNGGGIFSIDWDTGTSYPDHLVKVYLRPASVPYFTEAGIEMVARDEGAITIPATQGVLYRLNLRVESLTEHCKCITTEILADSIYEYPLGEDLVIFGNDEVFFGTEYVYA